MPAVASSAFPWISGTSQSDQHQHHLHLHHQQQQYQMMSVMDKYSPSNSYINLTSSSSSNGIHMASSSPSYFTNSNSTGATPSSSCSNAMNGILLPRASQNSFSYPSPSFERFGGISTASTLNSNGGYGYSSSSASSSTAPLPSPDCGGGGYYGIPLYSSTNSWDELLLKQEPEQPSTSSIGPIKSSNKVVRRRSKKVSKSNSSDSNESPPEGGRRARRYKTPSPQILRVRREAANARERRRMNNLNVAYDMLRHVLPDLDEGRRLSKMETLQMAQIYIENLADLIAST